MPDLQMTINTRSKSLESISGSIDALSWGLRALNLEIHDNPELCFAEVQAHDNIAAFLERHGISVSRHAFGLHTSLTAEYGEGGRIVTFCAEYDALPVIGHGCGHNLIAVSSIAAFLGAVAVLKATPSLQGRVRLLGCPAEEGGAGKVKLIKAGAFIGVDAALMIHPTPSLPNLPSGSAGVSYTTCLASCAFDAIFIGKAAHGAAAPWAGVDALDAAALAYTGISMHRQQIWPTDRVQVNICNDHMSLNVIPERSIVRCSVRSQTVARREELKVRIENCFTGASVATGCTLEMKPTMVSYSDLRPNESLCLEFSRYMALTERQFDCNLQNRYLCSFATDMGNVSYEVPSFHGTFTIPTDPGVVLHSTGFTKAARTEEAHDVALGVGKGMAAVGLRVLYDDLFWEQTQNDFRRDKQARKQCSEDVYK